MTRSHGMVLRRFGEPLTLEPFTVPDPEPGAVIAAVRYGGICGTDAHLQQGHLPMPTPVILGHEAVGRVEKLGEGVESDALGVPLGEGDLVLWASNIPCGRCAVCVLDQERTLCPHRKIYGINQRCDVWPHLSGGWADRIYLQPGSTVIRIPEGVRGEDAISLGCAGPTVCHGVLRRAGVSPGATVAIQGSGPVGMAAAMYARLAGAARVILLGGPANRLELARELALADEYVDIFAVPDPDQRVAMVRDSTVDGQGADLVVECTGVPAAVAEGLDLCRPSGTYAVLGQYTDHGETLLNPHFITRKQLRLVGSWAFAEAHYVDYVRSLPRLLERFDLSRLVTVYPLDRANEALGDVRDGKVVKAVLAPAT